MTRNRLIIAGTTVAALGLAVFTAWYRIADQASAYKPSSDFEFKTERELEGGDANGAAQWRHQLLQDANGQIDMNVAYTMEQRARQSYASQRSANANTARSASAATTNWVELGPDNVGGRTRAILIDRSNSQHMFAGGVTGGLWESFDGANNWQKCAGYFAVPQVNQNVGCIAQGSDGAIYVGTGEEFAWLATPFTSSNGSFGGSFLGGGMYKSTDGGVTFSLLTSTKPTVDNSPSTPWASINDVLVSPTNSQLVVAATNRGIRVSSDGGQTWNTPSGIVGVSRAEDVEFCSDGTLLVTVIGKPYRSRDNGATFSSLGLSSGFNTGALSRTELAIAPSDNSWVYALCAKSSDNTLAGVYLSIDTGTTWTQIAGSSSPQFDPFGVAGQGQGEYDNICAVDPWDKNRCIFGGVQLWAWDNGVVNPTASNPPVGQWSRIAAEFPASIFNPYYVHSDKHAIVFHPTQQNTFFIGTDGGIARTTNNGATYISMNSGYSVTQFYSVAHDHFSTGRNIALGGTQDNGTQYIDGLGNTIYSSTAVSGGDGAHCEISFLNPNAQFSTLYYGLLARSNTNGESYADFYSERVTSITNPAIGDNAFASFVTPIRLWESLNNTTNVDSVEIINPMRSQIAVVGDGTQDTYSYTFNLTNLLPVSSPLPVLDVSSLIISAGQDTLTCDVIGNISGDGTGVAYQQGQINFTFNTPPSVGTAIRVTYGVRYSAGTTFQVQSKGAPNRFFPHVAPNSISPNTITKVQDVFSSRLAVGCFESSSSSKAGILITKGALDFSTNPEWIKVAGRRSRPSAFIGTPSMLVWSPSGNHLYVGTEQGEVFRVSNLNAVIDSVNGDVENNKLNIANPNCVVTCTKIADFGSRFVSALDVDPADEGRVLVTLGNYTQTQYVYMSTTADSDTALTSGVGSFAPKTGNMITLGAVPAYGVAFDKYNPGRVLVTTERGVIETNNINATPVWAWAIGGLNDQVGTYMIRQQRLDPWHVQNAGCFYIGTYGRGIWRDDGSWQQPTSVNEPGQGGTNSLVLTNGDLRVFPNPVVESATVAFRLAKAGDVQVRVYDLSGKLVHEQQYDQLLSGDNKVNFTAQQLVKGTYVILVAQNNQRIGTGRFVKMEF